MSSFGRNMATAAIVAAALIGISSVAHAFDTRVLTFDNGTEGWTAHPDFESILDDGGEHGPYWKFTNVDEENNVAHTRGWYRIWNDTDPAFIGDYTQKGEVRISIDVDVNFYDLLNWGNWMEVEEYREVAIELRDYDNPYTDPDTGYSWPWKAAQFMTGYLPNRDAGWVTYYADVVDVHSDEVPEGWVGFGGPEDPETYMPQLPPDTTWTQFLQGVDEVVVTSSVFGWFYSLDFKHSINVDNITISEMPRSCNGMDATVYVNNEGIVVGGRSNGLAYSGVLDGSDGNDVIVGTGGRDTIYGRFGADIICGMGGDDNISGQEEADFIDGGAGDDKLIGREGDDFIHGGEGHDFINGGEGTDSCVAGERLTQCESRNDGDPPRPSRSVRDLRSGDLLEQGGQPVSIQQN